MPILHGRVGRWKRGCFHLPGSGLEFRQVAEQVKSLGVG